MSECVRECVRVCVSEASVELRVERPVEVLLQHFLFRVQSVGCEGPECRVLGDSVRGVRV